MWFERSENARQKTCEQLEPQVNSFALVCLFYCYILFLLQGVHIRIISLRPPMETYKSYVHLPPLILNGTYTKTLPRQMETLVVETLPLFVSQRAIILRHL